jgi:site-specific DNA-methyltransferase (cytosine-N4-specific)
MVSAMLPDLQLENHTKNGYGTHNLHPYPAKFIPQIPSRLIETLSSPSQLILDPFCGSGTTLVEARRLNRRSIGSDSNDLAVMIARAKSLSFSKSQLQAIAHFRKVIECAHTGYTDNGKFEEMVELPDFRNRELWFDTTMLLELMFLRNQIAKQKDKDIRDFLLVVLSAIVVRSSRQDSETRWKSVDKRFKKGLAFELFLDRLSEAYARVSQFSSQCGGNPAPQVIKANAKALTFVDSASVDLVVTSPPYMNSFDYYLYHKLRLFVLGIDHYSIQDSEIGSRNKHCDKKQGHEVYSREMSLVFDELHRVLKPSGLIAMVIGDSIYKGALVPMDYEIERIAQSAKLSLADKFSYDQRRFTRSFTKNLKHLAKQCHVLLFSRSESTEARAVRRHQERVFD